jgi:hypothetical protein
MSQVWKSTGAGKYDPTILVDGFYARFIEVSPGVARERSSPDSIRTELFTSAACGLAILHVIVLALYLRRVLLNQNVPRRSFWSVKVLYLLIPIVLPLTLSVGPLVAWWLMGICNANTAYAIVSDARKTGFVPGHEYFTNEIASFILSGLQEALPWAFVAVFAYVVTSVARVCWWHRRLLARSQICMSCGYKIAGLSSSICPECGSSTTYPREVELLYSWYPRWVVHSAGLAIGAVVGIVLWIVLLLFALPLPYSVERSAQIVFLAETETVRGQASLSLSTGPINIWSKLYDRWDSPAARSRISPRHLQLDLKITNKNSLLVEAFPAIKIDLEPSFSPENVDRAWNHAIGSWRTDIDSQLLVDQLRTALVDAHAKSYSPLVDRYGFSQLTVLPTTRSSLWMSFVFICGFFSIIAWLLTRLLSGRTSRER